MEISDEISPMNNIHEKCFTDCTIKKKEQKGELFWNIANWANMTILKREKSFHSAMIGWITIWQQKSGKKQSKKVFSPGTFKQ